MPAASRPPEIETLPPVTWNPRADGPPRAFKHVYSPAERMLKPEPVYVLDGFLPSATVGWVAGHPGSGKTLLLLDWSLSIAMGRRWLGNRTVQQNVLYVTDEGLQGLTGRIEAWCNLRHVDINDLTDHWTSLEDPLRLGGRSDTGFPDRDDVEALCESLGVGVLVIDPQADYFVGSGNDDENASNLTLWAKGLAGNGMLVMIGHHLNKMGSGKGATILRGSTVFGGAADWLYSTEKKKQPRPLSDQIVLSGAKSKDSEEAQEMTFEIVGVPTTKGFRKEGEEMGTSPALRFTGYTDPGDAIQMILMTLIEQNPLLSGTELQAKAQKRKEDVLEALHTLSTAGKIQNQGTKANPRWAISMADEVDQM